MLLSTNVSVSLGQTPLRKRQGTRIFSTCEVGIFPGNASVLLVLISENWTAGSHQLKRVHQRWGVELYFSRIRKQNDRPQKIIPSAAMMLLFL